MKVLCITSRCDRPSVRFRVAQAQPYFETRGHECTIEALPLSIPRRLKLYNRLREYDVVLIQQRLFSAWEVRRIRRNSRVLVYDFDDAIMFNPDGTNRGKRRWRFRAITSAADLVICGNQYLAEFAAKNTAKLIIIPTAIDTKNNLEREARVAMAGPKGSPGSFVTGASQSLQPRPPGKTSTNERVTIGWTGSRSTNRYLGELLPILARVRVNFELKIISSDAKGLKLNELPNVPVTFIKWTPELGTQQIASFDIGLMPLPDNAWTRGKCGCKALQYMSLGIPAVCSPVGVNSEIIENGKSGYLPASAAQWCRVLEGLIAEVEQRETIGIAGRKRVEQSYSLEIHGQRLVQELERVAA